MAETLHQIDGDKPAQYDGLLPQIVALISDERDFVANMANIAAVLKTQFDWLWVGFYLVKDAQLVLGPFQGPIACTRIAKNKGVCGTAWAQERTIVVEDVNQFAGHIACSSLSQSEIVVPMMKDGRCVGVLDVDSDAIATFGQVDADYLEQVVATLMAASDVD
ncbi:GAF domain-containing protein [Vitreoscilla stercoraria]|uniref:GAF domain-containing protein n=1 Tax=Vitreoscilla stercoraria TaxID=61 RepID=A0ABY4EBQ6_VITST|nr:GAF domain-containing protein [Vitreoscilla stercoraria]UOO92340.1 GAF domain-containing protein [Vitreoscilla stercoraria]